METRKQSGAEMMLRSLGLGEIVDAAQAFAAAGTVAKILKFADDLETNNRLLEEIRNELQWARLRAEPFIEPNPTLLDAPSGSGNGAGPGDGAFDNGRARGDADS